MRAQLAEQEMAEQEDRRTAVRAKETREAAHEVERRRFARSIDDAVHRKAIAVEAAAAKRAAQVEEEQRGEAVVRSMKLEVEVMLGQLNEERLLAERRFQTQLKDEEESGALEAHVVDLLGQISMIDVARRGTEAWRRGGARWDTLCRGLLDQEVHRAFEFAIAELEAELGGLPLEEEEQMEAEVVTKQVLHDLLPLDKVSSIGSCSAIGSSSHS